MLFSVEIPELLGRIITYSLIAIVLSFIFKLFNAKPRLYFYFGIATLFCGAIAFSIYSSAEVTTLDDYEVKTFSIRELEFDSDKERFRIETEDGRFSIPKSILRRISTTQLEKIYETLKQEKRVKIWFTPHKVSPAFKGLSAQSIRIDPKFGLEYDNDYSFFFYTAVFFLSSGFILILLEMPSFFTSRSSKNKSRES